MRRRLGIGVSARLLHLAIVLALCCQLNPFGGLFVAAPVIAADDPDLPPPDPPALEQVPPVADPRLPSLTVHVAVTPDPVAVGEVATIELTVTNGAPDPADELAITLAPPAGAVPQPGDGFVSARDGWRWEQKQLGGGATTTVRATVLVAGGAPGDAILARAAATARGIDLPIVNEGGALVLPAGRAPDGPIVPETAPFVPGQTGTLRSADGKVEVRLPANAAAQPLTLRHTSQPEPGDATPPAVAGFKRGLGVFFLRAVDDGGRDVRRFAAPLAIAVRYTPEQLAARGIAEADLVLTWFDADAPGGGRWMPLPTTVDRGTKVATATVDHFSPFQLGSGAAASDVYTPSVEGWQVAPATGAATYGMSMPVPAGPAGIRPDLQLGYSSAATDGDTGERTKQQASWVGKGWSLDTGYIALQRLPFDNTRYYTLVLNGRAHTLTRGEPLVTGAQPDNPSHWYWPTGDEAFLKVRAESASQIGGRGGTIDSVAEPRYTWRLRTTDGTLYEFQEDLWWGFQCTVLNPGAQVRIEQYRWLLSRVTDTHGNAITYSYGRDSAALAPVSCNGQTMQGVVDRDAWPTTITWAGTPGNPATDRYKVEFVSYPRDYDTTFDGAETQYGGVASGSPRETRRLDAVRVYSKPATTFQLVRQYNLGYHTNAECGQVPSPCLTDDEKTIGGTHYYKLTLTGTRPIANDGTTALPRTTFGYGTTRGTDATWPNADWNRLNSVNNGQGGTLTLAYAQIGQVTNKPVFNNRRRVTTRTSADGRGNTYQWAYDYTDGTPAINSLGSQLSGNADEQLYPNSAALYFNARYDPPNAAQNAALLATPARKEFRGHRYVKVTDPAGAQTERWFYQGDVDCAPTASGPYASIGAAVAAMNADSCFTQLRAREFLRGREYRTRMLGPDSAGSPVLRETERAIGVDFDQDDPTTDDSSGYTKNARSGLWRAWQHEDQRIESAWEGGGTPSQRTTSYGYDAANYQDGGQQFGNVTRIREREGGPTGPTLRLTERWFASFKTEATGGGYIVNRVWQEAVRDEQDRLLALSNSFYDGVIYDNQTYGDGDIGNPPSRLTPASGPTRGNLTLARRYYDVPLLTSVTGVLLHGTDNAYGYDSWGNRTTTTSYVGAGTRQSTANPPYSAPGNGSAALTTTTTYETTFNAFPTLSTLPPVTVGGSPLTMTEAASYDYRMGTLTSVTDANAKQTTAGYDLFGRLTSIVKPGDSAAYPTTQATYYDADIPFRYVVVRREGAGSSGGTRPTTLFYDGLGRQIQAKRESANGTQNVVTDTRYDGLGRVTQASQPRYVAETSGTFYQYTAVPGSGVHWTTTTYDGLGRALDVTAPDTTITRMRYFATSVGTAVDTTDANAHKTRRESDLFGRLRAVLEYSGTTDPYTLDATTTYAYDGRDLLTSTTDTAGNVTTIGYDSLGRKTGMADPDMGAWSYTYNPIGTLATQTDAKAQTITFSYDPLDRLTGKTYSTGYPTATFRYDEADVTNGRGRLTTEMNANTGARYGYDARGNRTSAVHTVAGLTGSRAFAWTYDSADRVATMTYPARPNDVGAEQVVYTYDAAWRQTSVAPSNSPQAIYAGGATYSALDQPLGLQFRNGITQTWAYASPMQRLQSIVVGSGGMNRSYTYDNVGNVKTIADTLAGQTQNFDYDHRDRLTRAYTSGSTTAAYDESSTYDALGNLTGKGPTGNLTTYTYPAGGPTTQRPHAPTSVGGQAQAYDANGNLTGNNKLALTWSAENLPLTAAGTDAQAAPKVWGQWSGNCDGTSFPRVLPVAPQGIATSTAVARSGQHSLAVQPDGTVRACGQNGNGQLGDGTTTARPVAVAVSGLTGVTAVAAGDTFSLALKGDGTVWAWGSNLRGNLGDGTTTQRTTPVQVSGLTGVAAIAAGAEFGLAVKGDGTAWAWGANFSNQLGDGTTTQRTTPVQVSGITGATAVAAGGNHGLALKSDGTVRAWGTNNYGQLGDGTTTTRPTSVAVSGLTGVTGIAAGSEGQQSFSLAVKSDGTVRAWGGNWAGQLGDGTTTDRSTPVQVSGLTTATAVAAGARHGLAILADGTVRAWGYNADGQLGDGTLTSRTTPVAVKGLNGVDRLAARGNGNIARATVAAESYTYDASGGRVTRAAGGETRLYLGGGLWEENIGGTPGGADHHLVRVLYTVQGRVVAQQLFQTGTSSTLTYFHQDHLGSVSVATNTSGQVASRQDYTPWGETRSGDIPQTALDYTGQRKDGTGLLFYNARYYDPALARFLSPDSVAPGKGDPQRRNRYSYVLNNPLKFTDPSGHEAEGSGGITVTVTVINAPSYTIPNRYLVGDNACHASAGNNEQRAENARCKSVVDWLFGWGIMFDEASSGLWTYDMLIAVWKGAERMSQWLFGQNDGRLFWERILKGRTLLITKVTEFQGCKLNDFACASTEKIIFTKTGLTGANPDQWAHNQKTVIHELAHVWDFRNGKAFQFGLELVRGFDGDLDHFPGDLDPGTKPTAEEDFAESVAFYAMEGSPIQGRREWVNSARWSYVVCLAQGNSARDCTR